MKPQEKYEELRRRREARQIKEAQDKLEREKRFSLNVRVVQGKGDGLKPPTYTGPVGFPLKLFNMIAHPLQFLYQTIGPDNRPTSEKKHLLVPPQSESPTLGACRTERVEVQIPREFLKIHSRVLAGGLSFSEFQRAEDKLGLSSLSDTLRAKQPKR